jgi:addiction module HigA family antidote
MRRSHGNKTLQQQMAPVRRGHFVFAPLRPYFPIKTAAALQSLISDPFRGVFNISSRQRKWARSASNEKFASPPYQPRTILDAQIKGGSLMAKKLAPVHPGEILREEFMKPLKLTPYAIAAKIGVPRTRIERVANEVTPVTTDTALRLGKFFGTTPAFWMNIQAQFDLETASDKIAPQIKKIEAYTRMVA